MAHSIVGYVLTIIIFTYCGRKLGWFLSTRVFYRLPDDGMLFVLLCIWGFVVWVFSMDIIRNFEPTTIFKWLLSYGSCTYVAIPNYGLIDRSTIPAKEIGKHKMISRTSNFLVIFLIIVSEYSNYKNV